MAGPSRVRAGPYNRARIGLSLATFLVLAAATWLVIPAAGSPFADNADPQPSDTTDASSVNAGPSWEPTTPDPEPASTAGSQPAGLSPVQVVIPSIDVDSSLVPLDVDPTSGALIPPGRYDTAGFFTGGPIPGAVGPAIIAGHVDSRQGPAVFYRLEEMLTGDLVSVLLSDGEQIDFRVTDVAQYPKSDFPTDEVYGPTPGRELRLITCGGSFDRSRHSYLDNIVVYAVRT